MKAICKTAVIVLSLCNFFVSADVEGQTKPELVAQSQSTSSSVSKPPTVSVKEGKGHLLNRVDVPYPPIARAAHVAGTVVVGAEINENGDVTEVVALGGPEMLRSAALDAVKQYKYRPFLIHGTPATVRTAVQVTFYPEHMKSN
ncbi:energy transducer TonB [Edaphobacter sp. HDX4]|uniref:energy transducer TonB n=1 Tax=Edaphobacter sp. HDX4 TaxID=2794064 RepID=UPI002FE686F0